jgi:hypothetical protein
LDFALIPPTIFLFPHRFLAGTARWESRLRAGGAAGFCFVRPLTDTLRSCEVFVVSGLM